MRISGGELKGRKLRTSEGPGYRPATSKVRQAIFSMLQARLGSLQGLRVLDVFAGSGSLAIESFSRGASFAMFVEKNRKHASLIEKNLRDLGFDRNNYRMFSGDFKKAFAREPDEPFDLVFVDPPYGQDLLMPALELLQNNNWLADEGLLLAEVESGLEIPEETTEALGLRFLVEKNYGQTRIYIWQKNS